MIVNDTIRMCQDVIRQLDQKQLQYSASKQQKRSELVCFQGLCMFSGVSGVIKSIFYCLKSHW